MDGKVYRQRLTRAGIFGAMVGILCPILIAMLFSSHFDSVAQSVMEGKPPPDLPIVIILFLSVSAQVGWIFVLIGREHYQFTGYPKLENYNPS
jgi:uncharacterized protein YqhQ